MRDRNRAIDGTTLPVAPRPTLPGGISSPVVTPSHAGAAGPSPPPTSSNGIGKQYGKPSATTGTNGAALLVATGSDFVVEDDDFHKWEGYDAVANVLITDVTDERASCAAGTLPSTSHGESVVESGADTMMLGLP
jgi:hypothetical protein